MDGRLLYKHSLAVRKPKNVKNVNVSSLKSSMQI